jgi:hypothetical protein
MCGIRGRNWGNYRGPPIIVEQAKYRRRGGARRFNPITDRIFAEPDMQFRR